MKFLWIFILRLFGMSPTPQPAANTNRPRTSSKKSSRHRKNFEIPFKDATDETDVVVKVEEDIFHLHSSLLSMYSSKLREMHQKHQSTNAGNNGRKMAIIFDEGKRLGVEGVATFFMFFYPEHKQKLFHEQKIISSLLAITNILQLCQEYRTKCFQKQLEHLLCTPLYQNQFACTKERTMDFLTIADVFKLRTLIKTLTTSLSSDPFHVVQSSKCFEKLKSETKLEILLSRLPRFGNYIREEKEVNTVIAVIKEIIKSENDKAKAIMEAGVSPEPIEKLESGVEQNLLHENKANMGNNHICQSEDLSSVENIRDDDFQNNSLEETRSTDSEESASVESTDSIINENTQKQQTSETDIISTLNELKQGIDESKDFSDEDTTSPNQIKNGKSGIKTGLTKPFEEVKEKTKNGAVVTKFYIIEGMKVESDVVIHVENHFFHLHSAILSYSSPVFKRMLSQLSNWTVKSITIENKKAEHLMTLFSFCYSNNLQKLTESTNYDELLTLCQEYQMDWLRKIIETYLVQCYRFTKTEEQVDGLLLADKFNLKTLRKSISSSKSLLSSMYTMEGFERLSNYSKYALARASIDRHSVDPNHLRHGNYQERDAILKFLDKYINLKMS